MDSIFALMAGAPVGSPHKWDVEASFPFLIEKRVRRRMADRHRERQKRTGNHRWAVDRKSTSETWE
jgi:hypothetical protein